MKYSFPSWCQIKSSLPVVTCSVQVAVSIPCSSTHPFPLRFYKIVLCILSSGRTRAAAQGPRCFVHPGTHHWGRHHSGKKPCQFPGQSWTSRSREWLLVGTGVLTGNVGGFLTQDGVHGWSGRRITCQGPFLTCIWQWASSPRLATPSSEGPGWKVPPGPQQALVSHTIPGASPLSALLLPLPPEHQACHQLLRAILVLVIFLSNL